MKSVDVLIQRYIEQDPNSLLPEQARIVGTGLQVGMVISYLRGAAWDVECTASAYAIPPDAVEAAHYYYHAHETRINAWIMMNVSGADAATLA